MRALVVLLAVALVAVLAPGSVGQEIACSDMACAEGWMCQYACSSWCGRDSVSEDRPVCNPRQPTHDASPPVLPDNLCEATECGFRSIDYVLCPEDSITYKYAGTSCVRQTDGSCRWELADCLTARTGPCLESECPVEPAQPPPGQSVSCSEPYQAYTGHYECTRNTVSGACRQEWIPCPVGCPTGIFEATPNQCQFMEPQPCALDGSSLPPDSECPRQAINECRLDFCGGCLQRFFNADNEEICTSSTRSCATIFCEPGYRCFEGATPGNPECRSTQTCDNVRCNSGEECKMNTDNVPECVPVTTEIVLNCNTVKCASYHTCEMQSGVAVCVAKTGSCSTAECATKPACSDGSAITGGVCERLGSGKCTWINYNCPLETTPPPTSGGELNCVVSSWTAWACSVPCNVAGVESRTRKVMQIPTPGGEPCPDLVQSGAPCTGPCVTTPPPPVSPPTCSNWPDCENEDACPKPHTSATCDTDGVWEIGADAQLANLGFVGCDLRINGNLGATGAKVLQISACATITVSGSATLGGRLSSDLLGSDIQDGTRVTVIKAKSIIGTWAGVMVSGLAPQDIGLPFKAMYTATEAHVGFGTVDPQTNTPSTASPSVISSGSSPSGPNGGTPTVQPNPPGNGSMLAISVALVATLALIAAYL